jgi:hypothetical protein
LAGEGRSRTLRAFERPSDFEDRGDHRATSTPTGVICAPQGGSYPARRLGQQIGGANVKKLLLLCLLLLPGCSQEPPALVQHNGPRELYKLNVPEGAEFKPDTSSQQTPLGEVRVTGEHWQTRQEEGAMGVLEMPAALLARISEKQLTDMVVKSVLDHIHGTLDGEKKVDKMGYRGVELGFTCKNGNRQQKGKGIYLRAGSNLYYCMYTAAPAAWDEGRATLLVNSFSFKNPNLR